MCGNYRSGVAFPACVTFGYEQAQLGREYLDGAAAPGRALFATLAQAPLAEGALLSFDVETGGVRLPTGDVIAVDNLDAASQGAHVSLAVRPEQVRIGDGALRGRVAETVYFGTDTHCHLRMSDDTEVVARMQSPPSGDTGLTADQTVAFDFVPGAVRVLGD